jgi:hypothetical protein
MDAWILERRHVGRRRRRLRAGERRQDEREGEQGVHGGANSGH